MSVLVTRFVFATAHSSGNGSALHYREAVRQLLRSQSLVHTAVLSFDSGILY